MLILGKSLNFYGLLEIKQIIYTKNTDVFCRTEDLSFASGMSFQAATCWWQTSHDEGMPVKNNASIHVWLKGYKDVVIWELH